MTRTGWILSALIPIAFTVGVFSSNSVIGTANLLTGDRFYSCLGAMCVGQAAPSAFGNLNEDEVGGITAWGCPSLEPNGLLFIREILSGQTCPDATFDVEFRNQTTRTFVEVRDRKIVRIRQGALHSLDF